ncbi:MAG: response regulator, partial [Myxococcota bacterium]
TRGKTSNHRQRPGTFTQPTPRCGPEETPPAAGTCHALTDHAWAEDNDALRTLIAQCLVRAGYHVLQASSGEEALRRSQERAGGITLLVSDVVMPGMSGPQLFRDLRGHQPHLRALFISGYTQGLLGPDVTGDETAFLQKPFTPQVLLQRVAELITPHQKYA